MWPFTRKVDDTKGREALRAAQRQQALQSDKVAEASEALRREMQKLGVLLKERTDNAAD